MLVSTRPLPARHEATCMTSGPVVSAAAACDEGNNTLRTARTAAITRVTRAVDGRFVLLMTIPAFSTGPVRRPAGKLTGQAVGVDVESVRPPHADVEVGLVNRVVAGTGAVAPAVVLVAFFDRGVEVAGPKLGSGRVDGLGVGAQRFEAGKGHTEPGVQEVGRVRVDGEGSVCVADFRRVRLGSRVTADLGSEERSGLGEGGDRRTADVAGSLVYELGADNPNLTVVAEEGGPEATEGRTKAELAVGRVAGGRNHVGGKAIGVGRRR